MRSAENMQNPHNVFEALKQNDALLSRIYTGQSLGTPSMEDMLVVEWVLAALPWQLFELQS